MVILGVSLEVLLQLSDSSRQDGDLDLGRARVRFMLLVLLDGSFLSLSADQRSNPS
jgi:hypothetical protein